MTRLRMLKPEGTEAFRKYIIDLRSGAAPLLTISELLSDRFSHLFEPPVEVGKRRFKNKLEMAKYLDGAFRRGGVMDRHGVIDEDGIWNWLSVLWFDQLTGGGSRVLDTPHYVLDQGRYRYRHLIRSAFLTYHRHGMEKASMLHMHPSKWGDLWEQTVGRGYLFQSPSLMSLIQRLCWNRKKDQPQRGATKIVREIWRLLGQFKRTYDVDKMNPSEIFQLIPQLARFGATSR